MTHPFTTLLLYIHSIYIDYTVHCAVPGIEHVAAVSRSKSTAAAPQ